MRHSNLRKRNPTLVKTQEVTCENASSCVSKRDTVLTLTIDYINILRG